MAVHEEPSMMDQLKEAHATIVAQLEEIRARSAATWFSHGREPPNNRKLISELEGQLSEIEMILHKEGEPGA